MFSCREDAAGRAGYLVYNSLKNFNGHIGRNGADIKLSLSLKFPEPPLSIKFTVSLRSIESINILMACLNGLVFKKKNKPLELFKLQGLDVKNPGRRPTLAEPIVRLPLARQRFTSGFGTGPVGPLRSGHRASGGASLLGGASSCLPGALVRGAFLGGIFLVFVVWQGDFLPV